MEWSNRCRVIPLASPPVVVRDLDDEAIRKLKMRGRRSPNMLLALSCGIPLKRFNRLPIEQQQAVRRAVYAFNAV